MCSTILNWRAWPGLESKILVTTCTNIRFDVILRELDPASKHLEHKESARC